MEPHNSTIIHSSKRFFALSRYLYEESNLLYQLSDIIMEENNYQPLSSRGLLLESYQYLQRSKKSFDISRQKLDGFYYAHIQSYYLAIEANYRVIRFNYLRIKSAQ
jgi:hypothetical protein